MNDATLSAAQQALEEFRILQRELVAERDKSRELSEQLLAERTLTDQLRRDVADWRQTYHEEKASAKRALLHASNLVSKIDSLQAICESIRGAAAEVAQKLALEKLDEEIATEAAKLSTSLPPNNLNGPLEVLEGKTQ